MLLAERANFVAIPLDYWVYNDGWNDSSMGRFLNFNGYPLNIEAIEEKGEKERTQ